MNLMRSIPSWVRQCLLPAALLLAGAAATGQTAPPLAWELAPQFKYRVENVLVNATVPGSWNVKVVFSVSNPVTGEIWDIKNALPFQTTGASLTLDIGWDPAADITNTGSANTALTPVVGTALGVSAGAPLQLRNLQNAATGANRCLSTAECPGVLDLYNRFWVQRTITPVGFVTAPKSGRLGIEGRPVCNGLLGCPPGPPYANIPVRSEVADFSLLATATPTSALMANPRRQIVDFDTKCKTCHNGTRLDRLGHPIPRLSLHGGNRNENLGLCVMCHTPNQTDVPYRLTTADARTAAAETPLDMKTMIHAIHAGGFRETPFVVIGFNSSINDFSAVRMPGELRNCTACHVDNGRKGSFELPLSGAALGTTLKTGSVYAVPAGGTRSIDVNPANDLKITPTAATCSGCHDKAEARSHMIRSGGASFGTLQQNIGVTVKERCASCHGPGKDKDVRKKHEIRRTSTSTASAGTTTDPRKTEQRGDDEDNEDDD